MNAADVRALYWAISTSADSAAVINGPYYGHVFEHVNVINRAAYDTSRHDCVKAKNCY
jgi:hypothetical protein